MVGPAIDLQTHDRLDSRKTEHPEIPQMLSSALDLQGKGSDYVLELAQKTNATHYLSGMHGKDYLDLEQFDEAKMGLVFQDFSCRALPSGQKLKSSRLICRL